MNKIKRLKVGAGSCGIAAGASELLEFMHSSEKLKDIEIVEVGCIGHCYAEPIVEVETDNGSFFYGKVKSDDKSIDDMLNLKNYSNFKDQELRTTKEKLLVTRLSGRIDPISLEEYCDNDGYKALEKIKTMKAQDVIKIVSDAGLRGRGGGGFPTGWKWNALATAKGDDKILICNADEGDPGAFMDRSMMESLPHQVMEGMLIGAYATGVSKIFIYVRAEYPLAIKNLQIAIDQIIENKLNVINNKVIIITIKEGAGAFVCGEETAMIHSLEGRRGTPRYRPPYPTERGFQGLPTSINNVETFANIPVIIRMGSEEYAKIGTEKSKGTKLFALAGDLKNPGLIEVPMGITIREIVYDIGGAEPGSVKAVQTGGPSGGCIPERLFDTPIDYDSLKALGAIMGSGGLIAIGQHRCMVENSRYFLDFTSRESCGKCTFCRVGTKRMLEILEKITQGKGTKEDIEILEDLGPKIIKGSLCGLGQTAPNPVLAALRYFREEFDEHVVDKQCKALECTALVDVFIDKTNCIECGLCKRTCPVNAISSDFVVDTSICTKCNSCIEVCPKNTISRVPKQSK